MGQKGTLCYCMLSLNVLLLIPPTGPCRISRISAGNVESTRQSTLLFFKGDFCVLCLSVYFYPIQSLFCRQKVNLLQKSHCFLRNRYAGKSGWGLLALQMTLRNRIHFPMCLLHKGKIRIGLLHKGNTNRGIMNDLSIVFPRIGFILVMSFSEKDVNSYQAILPGHRILRRIHM